MTKKDYKAIAAALKSAALKSARVTNGTNNPNRALYLNGIANAATRIADAMQADNARFDRARFLAACEVTP